MAVAWALTSRASDYVLELTLQEQVGVAAVYVLIFTAMIAFLAAAVAGVGLFMEDLRPGVHAFWRSRPIPIDHWFWLKYVGGLACLAGTLAATMA